MEDWFRGRPSWRPLSGGFARSVCLHLRLEPRHVVAENDQVVLDPGAVLDVIAQQGLASETHALEHRNASALVAQPTSVASRTASKVVSAPRSISAIHAARALGWAMSRGRNSKS